MQGRGRGNILSIGLGSNQESVLWDKLRAISNNSNISTGVVQRIEIVPVLNCSNLTKYIVSKILSVPPLPPLSQSIMETGLNLTKRKNTSHCKELTDNSVGLVP